MLLPQELIDIVSSYLRDDAHSLFACSLLSHQWLEASRRHQQRFHTIAVHASVKGEPRTIATFMGLLRSSPGTGIGPQIRHLCFQTREDFPRISSKDALELDYRTLGFVLSSLTRLRVLEMNAIKINLTPPDCDIAHILPTRRVCLHRLVLHKVVLEDAGQPAYSLCEFLDFFSGISELVFLPFTPFYSHPLSFTDEDTAVQTDSRTPPPQPQNQVASLTFTFTMGQLPFFRDLTRRICAESLCTLNIQCRTYQEIEEVGRVLGRAAGSLHYLTLDVSPFQIHNITGREDWSVLNLSSCTSLSVLTIKFSFLPLAWPIFSSILSTAPGTFMTLTIHFAPRQPRIEGYYDGLLEPGPFLLTHPRWADLDSALDALGCLEQVKFVAGGIQTDTYRDFHPTLQDLVRGSLPRMQQKGVLCFPSSQGADVNVHNAI